MPPTAGTCPSATTSPPTSATSTRATSRRWCGRASTARCVELDWGELQDLANQAAHTLAARGVTRGDRVAVVLPPTPETAAIFFGVWKLGAILLSMSVLYGDDGIEHRLSDSQARLLVTDAENAPRFDRPWAPDTLVIDEETLAARADRLRLRGHGGGRSCPALLHLRHDRAREGDRARAPLHPRPRGVHATATRSRTARGFHGMGEWAWAAGIAPLLGPWRLGAVQYVYRREAGFDPHRQLAFLSRHGVTNVFTTPTAMRSMMAIEDAGSRYPQVFRRVCSAGEPLNPEAIRWFREQYGVTVLDYYGLTESYPLVANYPVHGGAGGVDGQADAGLGRADPRRGRAAGRAGRARRDLPAGALEPALPARLLAQRRGGRGDVRRRVVPHEGCRRARTRTATTGTSAAPTT